MLIEPQTVMSSVDQVAVAKRAEANGFETLFRSDHYGSFPGPAGMPTTEAWTVLAGLAPEPERFGLWLRVCPSTFPPAGAFAAVRPAAAWAAVYTVGCCPVRRKIPQPASAVAAMRSFFNITVLLEGSSQPHRLPAVAFSH